MKRDGEPKGLLVAFHRLAQCTQLQKETTYLLKDLRSSFNSEPTHPSPYLWLVELVLKRYIKPLWKRQANAKIVRRRFKLLDRIGSFGQPRTIIESMSVGGVQVELIQHHSPRSKAVIVFLHGGAFCVRAEQTDRKFCKHLSDITSLPVVLVPYRLAPEHPFPAAIQDCEKVLSGISDMEHGYSDVFVIGHSAGANISLGTMMEMRDRGLRLPRAAVLLSAPTDLTQIGKQSAQGSKQDAMTDEAIWDWVATHYFNGADPADPLISPIHGEWTGLPPISFHASSTEVLLHDTLAAVDVARGSKVLVSLDLWEGMPHNFPFLEKLPQALQCRNMIADFFLRYTS